MTITFSELDHPRTADGTFTDKEQSAPELSVALLHSAFIDSNVATQEAAAVYTASDRGATASDFEAALFDTYDTEAAYQADVADSESELMLMRDRLVVVGLPSGGVAVFWG